VATLRDLSASALRAALGISVEAAGLPRALARTLDRGMRNETSAVSLYAPRTMFNQKITGSRRFAADDWEMERIRAVGTTTGTTVNDVVLAMCSGAIRRYLSDLHALPDASLVAMVPVGLHVKRSQTASASGGNALGAVMCKLGTDLPDPGDRLRSVHRSMRTGKEALGSMSPTQVLAMTALGVAPAVLAPMLRLQGLTRPPFNVVISNVPGPRKPHFLNGARLEGVYPLSIPIHNVALNITCTSYDEQLDFGLTGCRRTVPRLQRLLGHLNDELSGLERAAGIS
jgi:diacylglycerol O-acyltransferase